MPCRTRHLPWDRAHPARLHRHARRNHPLSARRRSGAVPLRCAVMLRRILRRGNPPGCTDITGRCAAPSTPTLAHAGEGLPPPQPTPYTGRERTPPRLPRGRGDREVRGVLCNRPLAPQGCRERREGRMAAPAQRGTALRRQRGDALTVLLHFQRADRSPPCVGHRHIPNAPTISNISGCASRRVSARSKASSTKSASSGWMISRGSVAACWGEGRRPGRTWPARRRGPAPPRRSWTGG